MNPDIKIDVSRARSGAVGADHGVHPAQLREIAPKIAAGHAALQADRRAKKYGFFDLYKDRAMLRDVTARANEFTALGLKNLVVLGIGGSALGLTTLVTALKPPYYNLLTHEQRAGRPRVFVMDNVDPDTFSQMMQICPPEQTLFVIISKSGGTAETLAQALIVLEALEKAVGKNRVRKHALVITGPAERGKAPNSQHVLRQEYRLHSLDVPPNVGGRFSVFSAVGLFPAAMLGIDIERLLAGCRAMDRRTSAATMRDNPAYLRAAYHYLAWATKHQSMAVMMPYSDKLRDVADWYRQLWAESLGKKSNLDGSNTAHFAGQTPIKSLGVTDQHSQLQLYLEGPNDKLITILEEQHFNSTLKIPPGPKGLPGADYLAGKTMNLLMASECRATADALRSAGRPVIRVTLPEVNAHTMGQLLYMLEVETAMAGRLFDVDAFDQPAVEAIKVYTREYMRKGK